MPSSKWPQNIRRRSKDRTPKPIRWPASALLRLGRSRNGPAEISTWKLLWSPQSQFMSVQLVMVPLNKSSTFPVACRNTVAPQMKAKPTYVNVVMTMASIVPCGMACWGSCNVNVFIKRVNLKSTKRCPHFQVTGNVSSSEDSRGSREKHGEDGEEAVFFALAVSIIRIEILQK